MSAPFWFRLTLAWCSGRPGLTLPFIAGANAISHGLSPVSGNAARISGYELWKIDNDGLIADSKGHFDSAEYERQLKEGVDG